MADTGSVLSNAAYGGSLRLNVEVSLDFDVTQPLTEDQMAPLTLIIGY